MNLEGEKTQVISSAPWHPDMMLCLPGSQNGPRNGAVGNSLLGVSALTPIKQA